MQPSKYFYDVIVIGGGASGMMAAGRAAERGKRVLLLEKNKNLGEKLKITGNGRSNITNAEENEHLFLSHYGQAEKFFYSSFAQFGVADAMAFFEAKGVPLVVEAEKRVFPKSGQAADILEALLKYMKSGKVEIRASAKVNQIIGANGKIEKIIVDNKELRASSYILATGGKSHPETGSTGDGFIWLKNLGHQVEEPTPAVVPLRVSNTWIKKLAGVSFPSVKITFFTDNKKQLALKGKILFTHFGLSGPLILNAAGKVAEMLREGRVTAEIDAYPATDLGALDKMTTKIFDANKNKLLKNIFKAIAPDGGGEAILSLRENINPETKAHSVTKEERKQLVHLLKALPVDIAGLMGYDRAVVSDGGLVLREIDGKTMRSRLFSNLYITGDLLQVNRQSGGYSLQLCWTTGYVAGSEA